MYGGTHWVHAITREIRGLSPRVRGNLGVEVVLGDGRRSIPACTGEPLSSLNVATMSKVYPRVYGGTGDGNGIVTLISGLSPRVRGNLASLVDWHCWAGSIPACTGEPSGPAGLGPRLWVYPRVYGGTMGTHPPPTNWVGLSPRVRGNRPDGPHAKTRPRSIPACTGEPTPQEVQRQAAVVYPRVYGGTLQRRTNQVYPRVYGGTPDRALLHRLRSGLSPRVRGNRARWKNTGLSPRVRGNQNQATKTTIPGLSPRVRGNRDATDVVRRYLRSIPACTGEPRSSASSSRNARSIPACTGEPSSASGCCQCFSGLSPRVRGNHRVTRRGDGKVRSIPACTGEPSVWRHWNGGILRVYPRVYGGTLEAPSRGGGCVLPVYPRVYGGTPSEVEIKWYIRTSFCDNQH